MPCPYTRLQDLPPLELEDTTPAIRAHYKAGKFFSLASGWQMFYIDTEPLAPSKTYLVLHGFPESSFSFASTTSTISV